MPASARRVRRSAVAGVSAVAQVLYEGLRYDANRCAAAALCAAPGGADRRNRRFVADVHFVVRHCRRAAPPTCAPRATRRAAPPTCAPRATRRAAPGKTGERKSCAPAPSARHVTADTRCRDAAHAHCGAHQKHGARRTAPRPHPSHARAAPRAAAGGRSRVTQSPPPHHRRRRTTAAALHLDDDALALTGRRHERQFALPAASAARACAAPPRHQMRFRNESSAPIHLDALPAVRSTCLDALPAARLRAAPSAPADALTAAARRHHDRRRRRRRCRQTASAPPDAAAALRCRVERVSLHARCAARARRVPLSGLRDAAPTARVTMSSSNVSSFSARRKRHCARRGGAARDLR